MRLRQKLADQKAQMHMQRGFNIVSSSFLLHISGFQAFLYIGSISLILQGFEAYFVLKNVQVPLENRFMIDMNNVREKIGYF